MSEFHDGSVIQSCVRNPHLHICFCFNWTGLWLDFCQGDKHVSVIKTLLQENKEMIDSINPDLLLTTNCHLHEHTPAKVFLVRTHIQPSQQLTEHTDTAVNIVFIFQMIYRTPTLYYCMWMSLLTPALSLCQSESHLISQQPLHCLCVCVCAYVATCMLVQPVKSVTLQGVIVTPKNPIHGI